MLRQSLYYLVRLSDQGDCFSYEIQLDAKHEIFQNHFPGCPILPGACIVEMVKELLTLKMEKQMKLIEAKQIKFLFPINPEKYPEIDFCFVTSNIGDNCILSSIMIKYKLLVFAKLSIIFSIDNDNPL